MIGKIIKFAFKAFVVNVIIGVLIVLFCLATCDAVHESEKPADLGYRNMSKVVSVHKAVEAASVGSTCICPICMKNINNTMGAEFVKATSNMNCCCPAHEKEYQEMYAAWMSGNSNKYFWDSHGVNFK